MKKANFGYYGGTMWKKYIIGIDEAGRGPWAGPIVVGWWMAEISHANLLIDSLSGLGDSKKVLPEVREKLYHQIEKMQDESRCQYSFSYRDAEIIDIVWIREANRQCMQDAILSLIQFTNDEDSIEIFIDGCDNYTFESLECDYLFAKKLFSRSKKQKSENKIPQEKRITPISQRIISYHIHGDALFPQISIASIIAKVIRDRMMCEYSEDFPQYGFESHKGYGTRKHRDMMINYGITPIHRKSYAPVKGLIS